MKKICKSCDRILDESKLEMWFPAIQAKPKKLWNELIVMTVPLIWVLYKLVAEAFGIP